MWGLLCFCRCHICLSGNGKLENKAECLWASNLTGYVVVVMLALVAGELLVLLSGAAMLALGNCLVSMYFSFTATTVVTLC